METLAYDLGVNIEFTDNIALGDGDLSIAYTDKNIPVAVIDYDILDGVPESQWINIVKKSIDTFKPYIPVSGQNINVSSKSRKEYIYSRYTQSLKKSNPDLYHDKLSAAGFLDDVVMASTNYINESANHHKFDQFARGECLMQIGNKQYMADVIVGISKNGEAILYDITNIDVTNFVVKKTDRSLPAMSKKTTRERNNLSASKILSQSNNFVNGEYSADGRTIRVNINGTDPFFQTVLHESIHAIQIADKTAADNLAGILNILAISDRETFGNLYNDIVDRYRSQLNGDEKHDADLVKSEYSARLLSVMFDNPQVVKALAQKNMNVFQKLKDNVLGFFDSSIERYKSKDFGDNTAYAVAAEKLEQYRGYFQKMFEGELEGYFGSDVHVDSQFSLVGITNDGRKIYKTNYPKNTQKINKQSEIIDLIQKIWHKEPIFLTIIENGIEKEISVSFDPTLEPRSDLSKIAFGNRKGNGSEKRITLDLTPDLYQIASDSKFVSGKDESGKDNPTHNDVDYWYYFVTNLVYEDNDGVRTDCYMNIDVKRKPDGNFFYSFAIEKGIAPQTLLAADDGNKPPITPVYSLPQNHNFDNTNINKNAESDLVSFDNNNEILRSDQNDGIVKNDNLNNTVRRIFTNGRVQYGLEPDVVYDSSTSFTQADIDQRLGRQFTIPDENTLKTQTDIKDMKENSLHFSDNVVFSFGNGADVQYGTGRILGFELRSGEPTVKIAVDSGNFNSPEIEVSADDVLFVSHNNANTITGEFKTSNFMYDRAKAAFENFLITNDVKSLEKFSFNECQNYLINSSERMMFLRKRNNDKSTFMA